MTGVWDILTFNLVGNVVIATECLHTTRTLGEERYYRVVLQKRIIYLVKCFQRRLPSTICCFKYDLNHRIRKSTTCISENKGAHHCSNCTADQGLYFRYTAQSLLNPKLCFMSDLVGNSDWFSCEGSFRLDLLINCMAR